MKTNHLQKMVAVMTVAGLALSASTAVGPGSSAPDSAQPAAVNAPVPQLSYGVAQIVKLAQANVSDDAIMAYIKSSGNSYGLNADQIIYLRQQGVSDAVITTMLNQPRPGLAVAVPTTPVPQPMASTAYASQDSADTVAPPVTYVQTVPATTYYYQPYYYYPAYGWCLPVTYSFGWGGYYRGYYGSYYRGYYGGYRGGWHGGWRGGASSVVWHGGRFAGGWHGGAPGGGWHGGGSAGGWHGGWHR